MRKILPIIGLLLAFAACEEVYKIPPQSQVQINFYKAKTEESTNTLLSIKGLNNDSIWVSNTSASSFVLPLGNSGSDSFILMMDSVADTLQIDYTPILNYESMATGFYYDYYLHSGKFTKNKMEKVYLIDTLVMDQANENIRIFLNDSTGYTVDK